MRLTIGVDDENTRIVINVGRKEDEIEGKRNTIAKGSNRWLTWDKK